MTSVCAVLLPRIPTHYLKTFHGPPHGTLDELVAIGDLMLAEQQ